MTVCCYCHKVMDRIWPVEGVSHGVCKPCLRVELAKIEEDSRKARANAA